VVYARSLRVGGDKMDDAIVAHIRRTHQLLIGEASAERLKLEIGAATMADWEDYGPTREVRGRDLHSGVPREITISQRDVAEGLWEVTGQIVEAIHLALESTPPELAGDIVDRGIVLTGGGALLPMLDQVIAQTIGVPVVVAKDPLRCVAIGTGRALEDLEGFKYVLAAS
jgi:rod shape-determining protein MreB